MKTFSFTDIPKFENYCPEKQKTGNFYVKSC